MDYEPDDEFDEAILEQIHESEGAVQQVLSSQYAKEGILVSDWVLIFAGVDAEEGDQTYHVLRSENLPYHSEQGLINVLRSSTEL